MKFVFDLASLYYLPQYTPVAQALRQRGQDVSFLILAGGDPSHQEAAVRELSDAAFAFEVVGTREAALAHYQSMAPDWVLFGNDTPLLDQLPSITRTALLYHGIGVKSCYYGAALSRFTVRFSEGRFRTLQLQKLFPHAHFVDVGFAKLDPLLGEPPGGLQAFDLLQAGLDPHRPTVLYAPTYYPSSIECLPWDWPASLAGMNLIIKPHMFTWSSDKYAGQQKKLRAWQQHPNVHLAEVSSFSLLPFMAVADVLVSEASSAIFEFAALDKPVVWCDFYRLRWSYRGPFRYRHTRRMDQTMTAFRHVGAHARRAADLASTILDELAHPERHASARKDCSDQLIGVRDGHASTRIAEHLMGA